MGAELSLPDRYRDHLQVCIDERGIGLPHALVLDHAGTLTMIALDVSPDEIYRVMLRRWRAGAKEMIFALDRFATEGQGTTLGDLVAGHYFVSGEAPRPFVIEYQHEPRVLKAVEWNNPHWNAALTRELAHALVNV